MAGTGIQSLTQLETPFLRSLNLSHNNITHFGKEVSTIAIREILK